MSNLEAEDLINEVPPQAERTLFKGHKSLPRRRQDRPSLEIFHQKSSVGINNDAMGNGGDMPMTPTLPLTPPNQVQDVTEQESPPSLSEQRSHPLSLRIMSTSGTGSHQFSPPTPDVTPPRVKDTTPKARPVFPSLQSSMSSRADSFQTAQENLSDDDITESLYPSPCSMVARKWPKSLPEPSPLTNGFEGTSNSTGEEQGLGKLNGVKSSDMINDTLLPDKTPDFARTIRLDSSPLPKVHAKGTAKSRASEPVSPEETTPKKMTETKRVQVPSSEAKDSGKVDGESGSGLTGLIDNKQRIMDRVSSWRLSGTSFTSTIEAMVIEPSPPKQRTLRHIEKRASLRSVSSPQPRSTRTSAESYGDTGHRLVHKSGRISNENRNSVASDMSFPFSTTSTNKGNPEIIPVVVVPRRQSSLKSSAPSTRSPSAVQSMSLRCNTSVTRSKNSDQNQSARRHATSEVTNSVAGRSQRDSRGRESSRPAIPTRSSSLSAPTSRNNSRTTSLTSESLRRHTEQMQMAFQAPEHQRQPEVLPSPRIVLPEGPHAVNIKMDTPVSVCRSAEDAERLHAPSLHFTMSSVVSSSPGPVEVNEATMVTYFPHNNNSLLLIDSKVQPESRAVKALRGQDLSTPYMVSTPQRSAAVLDIESPLRNPRTPPVPPVYAPGLPERMDSSSSRNADLSRQGSNRINRGLGSMKRALSARRHSDGARPQPVTRSLSVRSSRSRRAEKANNSQLNSFWRPRPFWDGFDSSPGNERGPVISTEREGYPMDNEDVYVSNSLGLPQKRVIFSGPLVLARRISNARKSRRQQVRHQQFNQSELSLALGITRPRSPYQRQTVRYRLQRGIFFPVRTLRKIKRRVKEARQQRARAALEARRERLKQSIGPKRITDPYVVGPFNHGVPYEDTGARPRNSRILLGDHVVG